MEEASVFCLFGMEKVVDGIEFSLSGPSIPGSDWRSGDGIRGTAGGGIEDKPLVREVDSSSMLNPNVPAETGQKKPHLYLIEKSTTSFTEQGLQHECKTCEM